MEIQVLAFGQIAEITGKSAWMIADIEDTKTLLEALIKSFPLLQEIKFAIAVNKKIINENTGLKNRDEVALLPPFSGG